MPQLKFVEVAGEIVKTKTPPAVKRAGFSKNSDDLDQI